MTISKSIRYSIFVIGAIVITFIVPSLLRSNGVQRGDALAQELEREVGTLFDTVLSQTQDPTRTMARDYSVWNEMVDLAEGQKGTDWARDNVDVSLDTYATTGTWIFSATGELRYSILRRADGHPTEMAPFFLPASRILELAKDKQQKEFYVSGPDGVYYTNIGGIVPVTDPDRKGEVRGYLVVSTLISNELLTSIASGTSTTIELQPPQTSIPKNTLDRVTGKFTFWRDLVDETGQSAGLLRVQRPLSSIALYSQTIDRETTYWRIILAVALLGWGASLYLLDRSRERAQLLAETMTRSREQAQKLAENETKSREHAQALAVSMTEELRRANGQLEQRVAERTKELAEDIKNREAFEQQLKKRTDELERLNKVMVDRELRVRELKEKVHELETPGNQP